MSAGAAAPYSVRFVDKAAQIDGTLWDECFPPPLEGQWWYEALERSGLEDQFAFLYGVIYREAEPVGIAPAFAMNFPVSLVAPPALQSAIRWLGKVAPSVVFPKTLFVGSPCADEGRVGLAAGADKLAALGALQSALAAKARELDAALLVWKDFPASFAADLGSVAARQGLFRVTSFPGTVVDLPPGGRHAYFGAMKSSRRHVLKKKLKRSTASVDLDVAVLASPDEAVLDEVFALFWQTYAKAATRFERLNRRFFSIVAAVPVSRFIVLREKSAGQAVAFMLCFEVGGRIINKFIGIDYGRPRQWLLYFRLWDAAVDFALSRGADSIQSGQTGYAPKIETGHRLVPLTNYCAHRNPMVHAAARFLARQISWATLDDDLERYLKAHPEERLPV
jgi:hypothetical protein